LCTSMGLAVPQSAQKPSQQPPPRGAFERGDNLMGTVSSVGADRIEIKKQDGTAQVVMVTGETHYRQGQQDIALEDLKPGDHISARGQTNDNKEFVANAVRRMTDEDMQRMQPMGDRAGGQIVSIDGNQLKVQNPRQGEKIVIVNDQTTFMKDGQPITLKDLKVGDRIFATGKETDGKLTATRVMSGQFQRGPGQRQREGSPPPQNQ